APPHGRPAALRRGIVPIRSCTRKGLRGSWTMSALGQKRTLQCLRAMSASPPKADIGTQRRDVRFVPKADIDQDYSITSSARASSNGGTLRPSDLAVLMLIRSSNLVG